MTKTVSSGLGTHLARATTSLATCWKVTRADGQVFGFTDADSNLVVSGVTYRARTGYTRTTIETNSALAVDNLELDGAFDDVAITELDLIAGLWDYASVEIFQVNWADLTQGTGKMRKGRLGEVKAGRNMFTTELRGLLQNIQQDIGREFGAGCDADLGDARCGISLVPFTQTGSITSVTSRRVFSDSALLQASGYFNAGKITFLTGENTGLHMEVKTYLLSGGQLTMQLPMPFVVAVGDTYTMHKGCDKSIGMCFTDFNNVVNHRGFPSVPGTDQVFSGGR